VRRSQGFFSISQTCLRCHGAGRVVGDPCRRCSGHGRVEVERKIEVTLPPGMDTGQRLRVQGEGEPGEGDAPRGDLYILVEVLPDEVFSRDGTNVICEIPISFAQAILGDKIRVPTLEGEAELSIPAGTQPNTQFRLRGKGLPDVRGYHTGDQLVRVQVEIPARISREQRELIEKFREYSTEQTYPLHRRFLDRLKKSLGS
jgi:molecular chaperone DnaJ